MKRLFQIILIFISPYIMWAQAFISEGNDSTALIEFHDGQQWVYRDNDGLIVGLSNQEFKDDYGKYYQIRILINNGRDTVLTFEPERVFADLLSNKGDTISLEVYTNEKYQKK